jgi:hypothetical protein
MQLCFLYQFFLLSRLSRQWLFRCSIIIAKILLGPSCINNTVNTYWLQFFNFFQNCTKFDFGPVGLQQIHELAKPETVIRPIDPEITFIVLFCQLYWKSFQAEKYFHNFDYCKPLFSYLKVFMININDVIVFVIRTGFV